jgi:hypothetical protein
MDIKVLDANPLYMNETYRLKFKFSASYPIGIFIPCVTPYMKLLNILSRATRGHVRQTRRSPYSNSSSYLHKRLHLSGSSRSAGLESGAERSERVHEYSEHVDGQHEE